MIREGCRMDGELESRRRCFGSACGIALFLVIALLAAIVPACQPIPLEPHITSPATMHDGENDPAVNVTISAEPPWDSTIVALPDLVVTSARVSMQGYAYGCVAKYAPLVTEICVRNEGNAATGPFAVIAEGYGSGPLEWEVDGLREGEERCLEAQRTAGGEANVDAEDEVLESDEANNIGYVAVPTPPAICTITPTLTPGLTPTPTSTPTLKPTITSTPTTTSTSFNSPAPPLPATSTSAPGVVCTLGTVQVCYWYDKQIDYPCSSRICPDFSNQWGQHVSQHAAYCNDANGGEGNTRVFGCIVKFGSDPISNCPHWASGDPRFPSTSYSPAGEHGSHPSSFAETIPICR